MNALITISGNIFIDGRMRKGTLRLTEYGAEYSTELSSNGLYGTVIPALINSHTHIGDSFVDTEPVGDIAEVFGPGGFKERMLKSSHPMERRKGISLFLRHMALTGTSVNVDFREGGVEGIKDVPGKTKIKPVLLGRAGSRYEADSVLDISSGLTISSISDVDREDAFYYSERARKRGKIFAMHLSERIREDAELALSMRPSFLVHCIECNKQDLRRISEKGIPVVISPRSNVMFGKRPDYAAMMNSGLNIFLGTDNCMTVEPDMFQEISFLYTYQRTLHRIDPETILNMVTYEPARYFSALGVKIPEEYIFYPNRRLSAYSIVTRGQVYKRKRFAFNFFEKSSY
ncbi:MAG: amidohydrolase family protein [Candidatus Thermoplasmatota archaeon]|nr:amidohydrolase family protein [Candidatus Thermoplasmatota archaeon]